MESIYLSKIASQWSGMMLSKAFLATRNINQKTKAMGLSVSKPVIENRNLSESIQARWVGNA
jgi:hypothetical protein